MTEKRRNRDKEKSKRRAEAHSGPEADPNLDRAEYSRRQEQPEQTGEEPEAVEAEADEKPRPSPEEIENLVREKEELYDRLLRTQADFDNYRKRVQKEQANLIRYGAENALSQILPVADNLERALDSALKHEEGNSQLREGIKLIHNQLHDALEKLGVTPIEAVGHPFDPNKHDALIRVRAPHVPEGTVVDEIRKGYYLHDKVLRPAQVTVGTHEPVRESQPDQKPEE